MSAHLAYRQVAASVLPVAVDDAVHSFEAFAYAREDGADELLVLRSGAPQANTTPLVRLHSGCVTGDALGSLRCDCGHQLNTSLRLLRAAPYGLLVYAPTHEGRGIGLANKLRAYALQDQGVDTVEANVQLGLAIDSRDYRGAAAALTDLGVQRVRLLTNNPAKAEALAAAGIRVEERVPIAGGRTRYNDHYIETKVTRMGHIFDTPKR